jgi:hypothetical protein
MELTNVVLRNGDTKTSKTSERHDHERPFAN